MELHSRKLLTIITESALEKTLVREIEQIGATGYTVTDARGKGTRGVRSARWDACSNIRIEIIANNEIVTKISSHLKENYYNDYAMSIYVVEIGVWRPMKF